MIVQNSNAFLHMDIVDRIAAAAAICRSET